jgi:hypothetical protein
MKSSNQMIPRFGKLRARNERDWGMVRNGKRGDMATPDELALWRRHFQELYESLINSREHFMAWSEELAMVEGENQTVDSQHCVDEIKTHLQRYREVMQQLPKLEEFTDQEVDKKTGRISQLLDISAEVTILKTDLPRQIKKLHLMLKQPLQSNGH